MIRLLVGSVYPNVAKAEGLQSQGVVVYATWGDILQRSALTLVAPMAGSQVS